MHQNHPAHRLEVFQGRFRQWLFLVPIKGGRWHIIPQLAGKIPLIYSLLGVV